MRARRNLPTARRGSKRVWAGDLGVVALEARALQLALGQDETAADRSVGLGKVQVAGGSKARGTMPLAWPGAEDRALGDQHVAGDDVLQGDQLDLVLLAAELAAEGGGDGVVGKAGGGGVEQGAVP